MKSTVGCNRAIIVTAIFGVLVSMYALYVELVAEARPGYKALCDISERASCSRVLTSEFSKGFGLLPKESKLDVPNCIFGVLFYCLMIFLATYSNTFVVYLNLGLAVTALGSSFYLAYLLIFVLKDLCIVCVSTYFINAILVILAFKKRAIFNNKVK